MHAIATATATRRSARACSVSCQVPTWRCVGADGRARGTRPTTAPVRSQGGKARLLWDYRPKASTPITIDLGGRYGMRDAQVRGWRRVGWAPLRRSGCRLRCAGRPRAFPASSPRAYTLRASRNGPRVSCYARRLLLRERSRPCDLTRASTARAHQRTPHTPSDRPSPRGWAVLPALTDLGSRTGRLRSSVGAAQHPGFVAPRVRARASAEGGVRRLAGRQLFGGRPIESLRPSGCPRPNAARRVSTRSTTPNANGLGTPKHPEAVRANRHPRTRGSAPYLHPASGFVEIHLAGLRTAGAGAVDVHRARPVKSIEIRIVGITAPLTITEL